MSKISCDIIQDTVSTQFLSISKHFRNAKANEK